jgi:predicted GNAT superfamily acetyltransferase
MMRCVANLALRHIEGPDRPAVLRLNEGDVEHLAPLDEARLSELMAEAHHAHVVVDGAEAVLGFVVTFGPGAAYDSPNYRWFAARYTRFLYLDRIVVAPEARRRGVASFVYDEAETAATAHGGPLVCEVNAEPANEASLAFHRGRGYREVGRHVAYGKTVALFESPTATE